MLLKQAAFWHKKSCRPTTAFYCYGSRKSEVRSWKSEVGSQKLEVRRPSLAFVAITYWDASSPKEDHFPSSRHALLSNLLSTAESLCRCGGNTRAQEIIAIRIVALENPNRFVFCNVPCVMLLQVRCKRQVKGNGNKLTRNVAPKLSTGYGCFSL